MVRQRNCREDRVYYEDGEGKLCSLATAWTSVSPVDPFVALAAGRSPFRVSDLLELCRLLDGMAGQPGGSGSREEARRV